MLTSTPIIFKVGSTPATRAPVVAGTLKVTLATPARAENVPLPETPAVRFSLPWRRVFTDVR